MSLKALSYYGGKAGGGKAQWIAAQLPWEEKSTYVEACGGMFGVGLARDPVMCEFLNDLDERVVNWWRVLRDEPERFGWAVQCTPWSRAELGRALERQDDPAVSAFDRAVAFHVIALESLSMTATSTNRWRRFKFNRWSIGRWDAQRVAMLAERMWGVQLEQRDAAKLIQDFSNPQAVIYVDPPYRDADTKDYRLDVDREALRGALAASRARVAVSGYGDEWDCLGWRRAEQSAVRRQIGSGKAEARTEVLWMNYDPPKPEGALL